LGSFLLNENLYRIKNVKKTFILLEIAAIVLAILLPFLFGLFEQQIIEIFPQEISQGFYMFLVVLDGIITGAIFPLAGRSLTDFGKNIGGAAGSVDAADHAGAFIGAFFMGTFLIPSIGFFGVVWIVSLLNLCAILFWLINPETLRKSKF